MLGHWQRRARAPALSASLRPQRLLAVAVIALLLLPDLPVSISASSGGPSRWTGVDGNYPLNWNYSPQTAIQPSNVNSLDAAWTFPVPAAPGNYSGAEGVMVTPLVVDGVVYLVANWHRLFALDAATGSVIWFRDLPLWSNYTSYLQPSVPGPNGVPLGHYHNIVYTNHIFGRPLVWVIANTYQVFAVDAYTGDIVVSFNPMARDAGTLAGNFGIFDVDTPTMMVDDAKGVLLFGPSVSEGESSGRGFVEAWNVTSTPPAFIWRDYLIPPQDGTDPSWSLDSVGNMTFASVFDGTGALNLKALPAGELRTMLYGDWGNFGFDGKRSYAGAGAGWGGSWAFDEADGMAFVSTSTATPDWNATQRPGLDLWSDSVMGLNISTGRMVWGFQAIPHPLGDFDCSWNVVLANQTVGGVLTPVVYKGCKNGYIFALNGNDGSLLWYLKPPSVAYENVRTLDPANATQMTRYNWNGYPAKGKIRENPSDTGALESDLAYDPVTNTLFAATYNSPKVFQVTDVGATSPFNLTRWLFDWGVNVYTIEQTSPVNATVSALDAGSGGVRWSYNIQNMPYRGGLTVSGGVVYVSTIDGVLRYLDEGSGVLLGQRNIGGSLIAQPSVGEDRNGSEMLFLTDMGSSRWGPVFPGFVQALAPTQPAVPSVPPLLGSFLVELVVLSAAAVGIATIWVWKRQGHRRSFLSGKDQTSGRVEIQHHTLSRSEPERAAVERQFDDPSAS